MTAIPKVTPVAVQTIALLVDGVGHGGYIDRDRGYGRLNDGPDGLEWPDRCTIQPRWRAFAAKVREHATRYPHTINSMLPGWRNEADVIRAQVLEIESADDAEYQRDYYRALVIAETFRPDKASEVLDSYDIHGLTVQPDWMTDDRGDRFVGEDDVTVVDVFDAAEWADHVAQGYPGEIMNPQTYVNREIAKEDPDGLWGALDAEPRT